MVTVDQFRTYELKKLVLKKIVSIVITQQPQMMVQTIPLRTWSRPLCGCSCGDCCYSCWCSCLVGKEIAEALGDDGTMWCCLYFWCCCWVMGFIELDFLLNYLIKQYKRPWVALKSQ